ncbi:ABC transporter permease [Streptomyces sp. NPDC058665]|uniref:ABC transporter permease n=1 Tax=Streptomyces sp. NPDC058665 TaxID=3346586 RepID=UPI0036547DC1
MNFVKRAALSLVARSGKTAILLGIFLVICTLLLGGFLLQGATGRQEAEAGRRVGVDVTVRGDELTLAMADALGTAPPVERYNPLLRAVLRPPGLTPLTAKAPRACCESSVVRPKGGAHGVWGVRSQGGGSASYWTYLDDSDNAGGTTRARRATGESVRARRREPDATFTTRPRPGGTKDEPGGDGLTVNGIRDSGMLLDFASGRNRVVAGRALMEKDAGREVVLLERRLAEKNGLTVGDTVDLPSSDGKRAKPFEIVGVYEDPRPDPGQWVPPGELVANQVYAPAAAVSALGFGTKPSEAVFKIGSPEKAERLHAEAARLLGDEGFRFDVNDKAFRDQVLPLRRVGAFAGSLLWLIALSGAVILGLIVMLTVKERRDELGMLLSLGEKKWKLIGQHTVEVAALLVPALAVAALAAQSFAEEAGETLLAREQDDPSQEVAVGVPEVRMEAADLGKVAGIGLGIALVATVIPGIGILRLHPRSILTDTE